MMIKLFLKKRIISHFIFISVILFGFIALEKLPIEELPAVNLDFAVIVTSYPGASSEEIERIISIPIEDALSKVEDIDEITSKSEPGKSVFMIKFVENIKNYDQRISDMESVLNKIPNMPSKNEMFGPFIYKIATGDTEPIISVMLSSDNYTTKSFKLIAEELKRLLMGKIKDIKDISIAGVKNKEVVIKVSIDKLNRYSLTIDDIVFAINKNNFRIPGGQLNVNGKEFIVKTVGNFKNIKQIKNIIVKSNNLGMQLKLGDIAIIKKQELKGGIKAFLNSKNSVSLYVMRKHGSNIVKITKNIKKYASKYIKNKENIDISYRNDQGERVHKSISILKNNAILGIVLVAILLLIFLGWRPAFLAVIGIPFSFLAAFLMMYFFGYTINSLSIFAMILVSGMLVDDAIVVIENVYRYREEGYSPYDAALKGTNEIIWPVISSILTTIAAFLPLLTISGVMGKFLKEMPIIVTFTLIASLLEAITVLPVHLYEMKKLNKKKKQKNNWWLLIINTYKSILFWALKLRYLTIILAFIMLGYSIYLAKGLNIVMFSSSTTDKLNAKLELPENTDIEETTKYLKKIEEFTLKKFHPKYVKAIVSIAGRVIEDNRWLVREHVAEIRMDLTTEDKKIHEKIKSEIRKKVNSIPKIVNFEFFKNANGPPMGRAIDISITGEELGVLVKIGEKIISFLRKTDGVVDLRSSIIEKNNQIEIIPNMDAINKANLSLSQIALIVRGFTAGKYAGKYQDRDGKELSIWVRLNRKHEYILDDIRNFPIRTPNGKLLKIGDLVKLKEVQKLAKIKRRNGVREIRIKANINSLKTTSNKVNKKISKELRPKLEKKYKGYNITLKGEAEDQKHAIHDVLIAFLMALILIYAILGIQFNSFLQPLIILTAIPFSLIGVAIGLHVSNLPLSFMAMISLVALIGIVVNDSIILVDLINKLIDKTKITDKVIDKKIILIEAGSIRLRPIILTTVTTIGGLIPMAFFATGASKTWQPMAVTIIWGIGFATILTLFIIPVIYKILDDIKYFFSTILRHLRGLL